MPPASFGRRLQELRKAKGMTQEALARAAGVSVNTISALERRGIEPNWSTAKAIAAALGSTLDELAAEPKARPKGKK